MLDSRFERFSISISRINRYVQCIKNKEMQEIGLKGTHTMCMYFLGKSENGLTSSQLCEACHEDKAAVSRAVNELIGKGYLYIEANGGKRSYRSPIRLSEKGQEVIGYINKRVAEILDIVGDGLTQQERIQFYTTLNIIEKNLEKYMYMEADD